MVVVGLEGTLASLQGDGRGRGVTCFSSARIYSSKCLCCFFCNDSSTITTLTTTNGTIYLYLFIITCYAPFSRKVGVFFQYFGIFLFAEFCV